MLPITLFKQARALQNEGGLSDSQAARKLMVQQARDERPLSPSQEAREILTDAALEQREELHLAWDAEERAEAQAETIAAAGRVEDARPWHCELPEGFDFSPEPWQAEDE